MAPPQVQPPAAVAPMSVGGGAGGWGGGAAAGAAQMGMAQQQQYPDFTPNLAPTFSGASGGGNKWDSWGEELSISSSSQAFHALPNPTLAAL